MRLDEAKAQLDGMGFKTERGYDSVKGVRELGECKVTAEWYERYQQWGASVSWRYGIEGNYQQGTGATLALAVAAARDGVEKALHNAQVRHEAQAVALATVFGEVGQ
jgi:hypothetical protein